jgi:hypothetical protein
VRYLTAAESWRKPLRSAAELLKPYVGARLAAYERFYVWSPGPLQWRLVVITERFEAVVAGPVFESRSEALIALPALARQYGCQRSN